MIYLPTVDHNKGSASPATISDDPAFAELIDNLVFGMVFNDLSYYGKGGGGVASVNGAFSMAAGPYGRSIYPTGSGSLSISDNQSLRQPSNAITFMVCVTRVATVVANDYGYLMGKKSAQVSNYASWGIYSFVGATDGDLGYYISTTSADRNLDGLASTFAVTAIGQTKWIVVRWASGTGPVFELYDRYGRNLAANTGAALGGTINYGANPIQINSGTNHNTGATASPNGLYAYNAGYVFKKKLTRAEVIQIIRNPYGMFKPGIPLTSGISPQNYNPTAAVYKLIGGGVTWTLGATNISPSVAIVKSVSGNITWTKGTVNLTPSVAITKLLSSAISFTKGVLSWTPTVAIAKLLSDALSWAKGAVNYTSTVAILKYLANSITFGAGTQTYTANPTLLKYVSASLSWIKGAVNYSSTVAVLKYLSSSISFATGTQNFTVTGALSKYLTGAMGFIRGTVSYSASSAVTKYVSNSVSWTKSNVNYSVNAAILRLLAASISWTGSVNYSVSSAILRYLSGVITFNNTLQLYNIVNSAITRFLSASISWSGGVLTSFLDYHAWIRRRRRK